MVALDLRRPREGHEAPSCRDRCRPCWGASPTHPASRASRRCHISGSRAPLTPRADAKRRYAYAVAGPSASTRLRPPSSTAQRNALRREARQRRDPLAAGCPGRRTHTRANARLMLMRWCATFSAAALPPHMCTDARGRPRASVPKPRARQADGAQQREPQNVRVRTGVVGVLMLRASSALRRAAASLLSRASFQTPMPCAASSQSWMDLVKRVLRVRALLLGTGAVCTAGGTACFAYYYSEAGVSRHICGVFEAGGAPGWDAIFFKDALKQIQRAELHNDLTQLLRPDKAAQYAVVVGAAGTGKSTAVRRAVRSLNEPKGAVYFLPPTLLASFSSELAGVLGYYRPIRWADRVVRLVTGETKEEAKAPPLAAEPQATWSALEPCLIKAAALYRAKHGVPAALVLDGMDLVAKKDPGFFLEVQDFAKKCADAGILSVVLVFSDGCALPLLESSSAISRADIVYEIGDVSDVDAVKWLTEAYNVDTSRATALVDSVAGGRFPLLRMCGISTKSVDDLSNLLDRETKARLLRVGVIPTAPLFRALLSSRSVDKDVAHKLMPEYKVQELLRLNILSAHPDGTYAFHDRHVMRFMERASGGHRRGRWW